MQHSINVLKNAREVCELRIKTEEHQAEFSLAMFGTGLVDHDAIAKNRTRIREIDLALKVLEEYKK